MTGVFTVLQVPRSSGEAAQQGGHAATEHSGQPHCHVEPSVPSRDEQLNHGATEAPGEYTVEIPEAIDDSSSLGEYPVAIPDLQAIIKPSSRALVPCVELAVECLEESSNLHCGARHNLRHRRIMPLLHDSNGGSLGVACQLGLFCSSSLLAC